MRDFSSAVVDSLCYFLCTFSQVDEYKSVRIDSRGFIYLFIYLFAYLLSGCFAALEDGDLSLEC